MNVQAVINNIGFPNNIDQLRYFVEQVGQFNVEDVLMCETVEWTMPKWAVINDIVFFYHAVTAKDKIRHLEIQIQKNIDDLSDAEELMCGLNRARELYNLYGGKIFAVARVLGSPFLDDGEWQKNVHWKNGRTYAEIGEICVLEEPIPIGQFSKFIQISRQSAITAVVGDSFSKLKKLIALQNAIPSYLQESNAIPLPLNKINAENWIQLTQHFRRAFFLEIQFRRFYVDFLIKRIGDRKTFYSECTCYKRDQLTGYVDNGIRLNGKLCFVEVKLNFSAEKNFVYQLKKYCYVDRTTLEKGKCEYKDHIVQEFIIVIDTKQIGVFDVRLEQIDIICELDKIERESDIDYVKKRLKEKIFETK